MSKLPLTALILALCTTSALADSDWRLHIRKEIDGWTASLSGPSDYGSGRNRLRGSGARVEKQRALASFTKLRIDGPVDVQLTQASADQATVIADDNIEPLIETAVEADTLTVRLRRDAGFSTRQSPRVHIAARSLQAISISGSGDLSLESFKGERLSLDISGSGDARLDLLDLRELSVGISGSGDLRAAGRAEQQTWALHGSGDVDARSLAGRTVKATLSGSGDMALGVSEQLDAQLSGSGDLSYAGRPQLRQSVSGSGEIHHR